MRWRAVGASASVIQMLVGFFMGLSVGAGVVIAQYFGAGQKEKMSQAVHSALALTVLLSALFTVAGIALTRPLLRAIGVPQEVLPHSTLYLTIYFAGITFLLFYNMGSGILRAIGNSRDPLIYLAVASVLNVILDVLLVCVARLGVARSGIGNHDRPGGQCLSGHASADPDQRGLSRRAEEDTVSPGDDKTDPYGRTSGGTAAEHYGFFKRCGAVIYQQLWNGGHCRLLYYDPDRWFFTACTAEL